MRNPIASLFFALPILAQTPSTGDALAAFDKFALNYANLHKQIERSLSPMKPGTDRAKIASQHDALVVGLLAARKSAVAGEIFTPAVSTEIRRILKEAMSGAAATRITKSLKRSEPSQFKLRINDEFPPALPLQTMPSTILSKLPKLPPELDYRIVGRSLVLRDTKANLIVDFLLEALP